MKCPHCGQEHPDNTKFCPETGKKLEPQGLFCTNPDCDFRQALPLGTKFCPNCGMAINSLGKKECSQSYLFENDKEIIFPLHEIILEETTIKELYDKNEYDHIESYRDDIGRMIYLTSSTCAVAAFDNDPVFYLVSEDYNEDIEIWSRLIPLRQDMSISEISKYCKKNGLSYLLYKDKEIIIASRDGHHFLYVNEDGTITLAKAKKCTNCGGRHFKINDFRNDFKIECTSCKQIFNWTEDIRRRLKTCPKCGSEDFANDGSGYLQFKCNNCDYVWGNEIEDDEL